MTAFHFVHISLLLLISMLYSSNAVAILKRKSNEIDSSNQFTLNKRFKSANDEVSMISRSENLAKSRRTSSSWALEMKEYGDGDFAASIQLKSHDKNHHSKKDRVPIINPQKDWKLSKISTNSKKPVFLDEHYP